MSFQVWKLSAVGLLVLAMSGCSAGNGSEQRADDGGVVEMGVSETCTSGSAPECVSVNGEYVLILESDFVRAGVESAESVDDGNTNAVDVKFDDEGAKVFQSLTAEAAESGGTARLVIKAGDEVLSAVAVAEPLQGDTVMIALPPEANPDELVGIIHGS